MPRIAEIDGIVVSINFDDHAPPHFHARYQSESVSIEIETGRVIGIMGRNQLNKVEQRRMNNLHYLRSKWKEFGGA